MRSPAQTSAGKSFRAKTRRKTNLEFEMSDVVVAVLMEVEGKTGGNKNINSKAEKTFKLIGVTPELRCSQPVL